MAAEQTLRSNWTNTRELGDCEQSARTFATRRFLNTDKILGLTRPAMDNPLRLPSKYNQNVFSTTQALLSHLSVWVCVSLEAMLVPNGIGLFWWDANTAGYSSRFSQ